ncbi:MULTISPECIES: UDP-N-acetylmuramoyl-tripeptide--D-alanyl-D-alanine ligase [unclassified Halorhodospira]|uniref:UDP-N-acetylmuramoyl-tripeptide--D-alanyl-D- alanine ligase n=1 Tax=unclassified Halorhodospira TaxID=2626748 RepID=UPI001EE80F9C|nr:MULTISPECIES: UDP-N-acetylmuramoyl-tripeptide--D-alanyl-D-alanine ligase [unclassified Halorhodospira]MCG5533653.1 UDP-N-acetylmuramoyl-tripeptide--D-alanyl-D-alanine ligase [Halorhodospira sp. 9621]MCG5541501.1 UDP-N-acetylmuramoyl-tripeptide--D-alanyl-D-alanine ligase [Halorhodospira sp. M39old]MCG5546257.1 UDP-N-acetylmuramoyl-tripeptide--D-alanyl-D-alanine ligase [Halorhodospira sp. M38]
MDPLSLHQVAALTGAELVGRDGGATVNGVALDSRRSAPGTLFVALAGARSDGHDFAADAAARGAVAVLGARPVAALPTLVVEDPAAALALLGAECRRRSGARVVAVTGSNGKTTVKELLAAMLAETGPTLATEGNRNNLLGVPEMLCRLDGGHRYAVIEMGANAPGEIAQLTVWAQPDVGVVTNAGPAHLEGFGSLNGVARAKGELFEGLPGHGVAVIHADDDYSGLWRELAGARRCLTFGAETGQIRYRGRGSRLELDLGGGWTAAPTPLLGRHNAQNIAAAAACAAALEVPARTILERVAAAAAVPGRLQLRWGCHGGWLVDDTYNANPASLQAAIDTVTEFGGAPWLLLGAMGELGREAADWHRRAGQRARAAGIQRLWTLGGAAAPAAEGFGVGGRCFDDASALIEACRAEMPADAVVLVKGSRSAAMEHVAAGLAAEESTTEGGDR